MEPKPEHLPVRAVRLADGTELAYADQGRGPVNLLFIHGLGSYLQVWVKNIPDLADEYRCLAPDLPNYGNSTKGDYPFSMAFFAQKLDDFCQALGLNQVILIGHSMGGQIAIQLALDHPEMVEKLILLAPAGFERFEQSDREWLINTFQPETLYRQSPRQVEQHFDLNFHGGKMPEEARFMYLDRLDLMQQQDAFSRYCHMVSANIRAMLKEPVFDRLSRLSMPVLVLFGREDALIPNKQLHPRLTPTIVAREGTSRIPRARLRLLSPCGHFIQWDCASAVNREIRAFVGTAFRSTQQDL